MDFSYSEQDEAFRAEVRGWLEEHLVGDFAALGPGSAFGPVDWPVRCRWEQELGRGGWFVVTVDPHVTLDGSTTLPEPEETTAGRIVAAGGAARAAAAYSE